MIATTAVIWAASGAASDYRVVETVALGETPPAMSVDALIPFVVATDDGYCAAWLDRRQGGAVLAARIGHAGKLRDRFGIPVAVGNVSAHHTIAVPGGCVVAWARQSSIHGSFIANDSTRAVEVFEYPYPRRILWKDSNRILLRAGGADSSRLEMRTGFGEVIASSNYDPELILAGAAEISGERFIVARKAGHSAFQIFRLDDDLNLVPTGEVLVDEDILPTYDFDTHVGRTGDALIIATQTEYQPVTVRWMTVLPDGSLVSEGDLKVAGVNGDSERFIGNPTDMFLAVRTLEGTLLISGFGELSGPVATIIESRNLASTRDETRETLFVSIGIRPDGVRGPIYEYSEPDGHGAMLTEAPRSQWLRDTASGDERVALVWREDSQETFELRFGLFDADEMELVRTLPVASFPRSTSGTHPSAGIAVEVMGNTALVVYWGTAEESQGNRDLFYRIASLDGEWLTPPVHLGEVSPHFDRDFVWSDRDAFYIAVPGFESTVRITKIFEDGLIAADVIIPMERGFLGAISTSESTVYADGGAEICRFSACPAPNYMAHLELLDESFSGPVRLTTEKLGALAEPWLSGGERSFLFGGWGEAHLFERAAPDTWTHTRTIRPGADRASFIDGRYFLTGQGFVHSPSFRRHVFLGELSPDKPVSEISLNPLVEDWTGQFIAGPFADVRSAGGRLILFSDVVSTNLEEGFVRRVRAHALERFEQKRRAVSRR